MAEQLSKNCWKIHKISPLFNFVLWRATLCTLCSYFQPLLNRFKPLVIFSSKLLLCFPTLDRSRSWGVLACWRSMKPLYLHLGQSPQIVPTDSSLSVATSDHKWINKKRWEPTIEGQTSETPRKKPSRRFWANWAPHFRGSICHLGILWNFGMAY